MPQLKAKAPAIDSIEQDFLDAIKRLQDGEPKHKKLKSQKTNGVLKVNVSTVALEAGRARTLIAIEKGCRYPRVRELIKQIKSGRKTLPTTHTELIQKLRADKAELAAQVKKYQAEVMVHFQARVKAEDEAARERAAASRLRKVIAQQGRVAKLVPTE